MQYRYDEDSKVLAVFLRDKPTIAYAREMGDVVLHFSDKDEPVYMEILNSDGFMGKAFESMPPLVRDRVISQAKRVG